MNDLDQRRYDEATWAKPSSPNIKPIRQPAAKP